MPLKTALKNCVYPFVAMPANVQNKFPGNIGEGISNDAATNVEKKATRISTPFIGSHTCCMPVVLSLKESNIAIFNKSCCIVVQQKYASYTTSFSRRKSGAKDKQDSVGMKKARKPPTILLP